MAETGLEQWHVDAPYVDLHCQLGEGPYYEKATNTLRFVDIKKKQIHTVTLVAGSDYKLESIQLDTPVSVTADIDGVDPADKILIGAKYGLAILERKSGKYEYLTRFVDGQGDARIRSNDGAADSHGRFWLGTMSDFHVDLQPEGSLLRFDLGKTKESIRTGLSIPNSVGWSPDGKTMYFTHSTAQQVLAFDYNAEDGSVSNERVFYHHQGTGDPDGFRVDSKGNIWHAIYGEHRVIKISPEGKLVGEIKLPTKNITCTEFVGTTLYITTANDEDGEEQSKRYGGGLFRVDVGVTGVPAHNFKLES